MIKILPFTGFSEGLFDFLDDLEKNNSVEWFNANRNRYQEFLVEPARAFVQELAPFLTRINPAIRTEPKFNKTIMRMNKDMRFAKGAPYKNYFLVHFGRFKMDSEFFVAFDKNELQMGLFLNNKDTEDIYFRDNFPRYKKEFIAAYEKSGLNGKLDLYGMKKEPYLAAKQYDISKDPELLEKTGYILLQKVFPREKANCYTDQFLVESVKLFSALYPLYAFSLSPDPLKEIERFEEMFGRPV